MASHLRRFARLVGLAVAVFLSLRLGTSFPQLVILFLALWILALSLDVFSTWRMYLLEPEKFSENESNVWFVALYGRLGFKGSVPPFLVLVEAPRFVVVALVCAPIMGAFLSLNVSYFAGAGVAAAAQGYAHFDGWRANRTFLSSKKGPVGEN